MYQLEVKHYLVKNFFHPDDGWEVTVDVDAMELAKGNQHKLDKKAKVEAAYKSLQDLGVDFGAHELYGRIDVSAVHKEKGHFLIEVEGQSSKQKEQAMYSALGQSILVMGKNDPQITYGIAVPDLLVWQKKIEKIPGRVKQILNLKCLLVKEHTVREI